MYFSPFLSSTELKWTAVYTAVTAVYCGIQQFRPALKKKLKQEFVRPRWPYDMQPSARAEKYIRDAGP